MRGESTVEPLKEEGMDVAKAKLDSKLKPPLQS